MLVLKLGSLTAPPLFLTYTGFFLQPPSPMGSVAGKYENIFPS